MSNPKWLIFLFSTWIALALIGGIIEGAYFGSNEATTFNTLINLPVFSGEGNLIGNAVATIFSGEAWEALFKMLTFDFAMFTGTAEVARWIIFMPIAAAITITFGFFMVSHIPYFGRGGA